MLAQLGNVGPPKGSKGLSYKEATEPSHPAPSGPWRAHVKLDPEIAGLKLAEHEIG